MICGRPHWGWVVVLGSFLAFFIADGWSYSFGMLYPELISEFGESKGITAYVPTLLYGIPMILSPLACSALEQFGCKTLGIFGGIVFSISLVLASVSSSFWAACLSVGFLTSVGLASIYISAYVAVTYWFDDSSRGLATGIAVAGSGIGSIVFPLLIDFLMSYYLWRGTVLILAAISLNAVISGFLYRPFPALNADGTMQNVPSTETSEMSSESQKLILKPLKILHDIVLGSLPDCSLLRNAVFCIYCFANFVLYLWASVPYLYIYDWATDEAGLESDKSAWLLSVIGISRTLGQIIIGLVCDRKWLSPNLLLGLCIIITGISTFFIPFSLDYIPLLVCCTAFGFTVSATYVLPMLCMGEIIGMQKAVGGFGLLQFVQGVATLIGTPTGGWIYDVTNSYDIAFMISGILIVLSGVLLSFIPLMKTSRCCKSKFLMEEGNNETNDGKMKDIDEDLLGNV